MYPSGKKVATAPLMFNFNPNPSTITLKIGNNEMTGDDGKKRVRRRYRRRSHLQACF